MVMHDVINVIEIIGNNKAKNTSSQIEVLRIERLPTAYISFLSPGGTGTQGVIQVNGSTNVVGFITSSGAGDLAIGDFLLGASVTAATGNFIFDSSTGSIRLVTTADNSVADASAIMEMESTTKGFLPPRMTTTQRDAIGSPATGLVVYNTTTDKLNVYTGAAWEAVTSA